MSIAQTKDRFCDLSFKVEMANDENTDMQNGIVDSGTNIHKLR